MREKKDIVSEVDNATLVIRTSFVPFPPWLQALVFPVIEIDGTRHKKYWGTHSFKVAPGRHTVRAWHRWFFFSQCHLSEITVDVSENTTIQLQWTTPVMVMAPGRWSRRLAQAKPAEARHPRPLSKGRPAEPKHLRFLKAALLALCLGILALRITYTEAPTAQMLTMPGSLNDTVYSLTVSGLLIFAFVAWLVVGVLRGRFRYRVTGMEFGLVLFGIAAAMAVPGASDKRTAITQIAVLLGPMLAALLLAQILDGDSKVRLVLAIIVALGVVSAYQCAEQFLVSNRITIEQYEQDASVLLDPLGIEPGTFQHFLFEHRLYSRGIRGFFTTSNSAASFGIMASFAAIALLIERFGRCRANGSFLRDVLLPARAGLAAVARLLTRPGKASTALLVRRLAECRSGAAFLRCMLLPALATAIVIGGLLLTQSKGGILAFAIGLAGFAALLVFRTQLAAHRRIATAILVPLVLLLTAAAGYAVVSYGMKHDSLPGGNSMLVRWQYWSASAKMYADHPWVGVGPGNFPHYYSHYKPAPALESVSDPHNLLLSLATQFGPLGLLGLLAMVFVPIVRRAVRADGSELIEQAQPTRSLRRTALIMLAAVGGCLLFLRPILIPSASQGDAAVLLYEIVTLYITPAAAFLIGFVLIAAPLEQTLDPRPGTGQVVLPAAAASSILAVLLHNLIDFAIFEPGVWMTFWIMMACLLAPGLRRQTDDSAPRWLGTKWRSTIAAGALALPVIYCVYVWGPAWDTTAGIRKAQRAAAAGQFDRAHDHLDAAFAADPLSATAVNLNGRLYMQQAEQEGPNRLDLLKTAAQCFRQAIEANPADYKNYEKLAQAYTELKQWPEAFHWYREATERYPGCERLWFGLAQSAEQMSRKQAALTYYTRAVEIEESYQQQFRRMYPDRPKVISRLGEDDLRLARKRIEELSTSPRQP